MNKNLYSSIYANSFEDLSKALSNPLRIKILKLLSNKSLSISEISADLGVPFTTIATNVDILEKANLLFCSYKSGKRGLLKICSVKFEKVHISLLKENNFATSQVQEISVPIGSYSSFSVSPTCGMASEKEFIGNDDDINSFYKFDRFNAQLIWFRSGYLEYKVPIDFKYRKIVSLEISFEFCSEAPGYRLDYPSDIELEVNGIKIGQITSKGDFGGKKGNLTPIWWPSNSTQYGEIGKWSVNKHGSFVNGIANYLTTIDKLKIKDVLTFRIIADEYAKNNGGINIFGDKFGNYPINIEIKVTFE